MYFFYLLFKLRSGPIYFNCIYFFYDVYANTFWYKHFVGLTCAYDVILFWLTVIVGGLQCLANIYQHISLCEKFPSQRIMAKWTSYTQQISIYTNVHTHILHKKKSQMCFVTLGDRLYYFSYPYGEHIFL